MPIRALLCFLLAAYPTQAQTPEPAHKILAVPGIQVEPIPGAPFAAEEQILATHTANGEQVTTEARATVARDAQGRVHLERHALRTNLPANIKVSPIESIVIDPVEGTVTECAILAKLCDISPLNAYDPAPFDLPAEEATLRPAPKQLLIAHGTRSMTIEGLGEATIRRLPATGTRRTVSSVAGVDGGDSPPITVVEESWRSTTLQVPVARSIKSGNSTQVAILKGITRNDPDPDLFAYQAGFTVRDHREGHEATGIVTPPVATSTTQPSFSEEARQRHLNASVVLKFVVDTNGVPQNVHVVRNAGEGLDENAVAAVKKYRFKPATLNGHPVAVSLYVQIDFHIR